MSRHAVRTGPTNLVRLLFAQHIAEVEAHLTRCGFSIPGHDTTRVPATFRGSTNGPHQPEGGGK